MRFLGGIKLYVVFKPLVLFMGYQFFPGWKLLIFLLTYLSSDILFSWGQEGLDSFFPFKKIKNHHLRTAICIYSGYFAPGCLMLEFVQYSETCKCLNMQNQKGALSVCLWLVVICVQESTQSVAEAGEEKSSMGTFHSRGAETNCQWE